MAFLALADGRVTIRRHDGDGFKGIRVEQCPRPANGLAQEFVVRIAELALRVIGAEVALAAVESEPLGMLREDLVAIRHRGHAMGDLQAIVVAHAEAHRPKGCLRADDAEAEIELPQRKIRLHRFVELWQLDRFERGQHLAKFARQIPAGAEPVQEAAHGIEAAAFIEAPDVERLVLRGRHAVRLARVARQLEAVFVKTGHRHAIRCTDDLLPLGLRTRDVAVVACKRPHRLELAVFADERQPVPAARDAIRAVFEPLSLHRCLSTRTDENFDRFAGRLRDDGQACAADLLDLLPKLMRGDSLHARGLFRDDDLRARLAVFDEERLREGG